MKFGEASLTLDLMKISGFILKKFLRFIVAVGSWELDLEASEIQLLIWKP